MKHRVRAVVRLCMSFLVATAMLLPQAASAIVYTSDPGAGSQWHLDKIGARFAWDTTRGSSDLVVAVIDTGVDIDNPDIRDNVWVNRGDSTLDGRDNDGNGYPDDVNGWNFIEGNNDVRPNISAPDARLQAVNHGTLVASLIAAVADNGVAGVGVAPRVKIMPLRVLDSTGQGSVREVVAAMRYAIEKRAHVINLSFVGDAGFDRDLFVAIRDAYRAGILVVAATGNEPTGGKDLDTTPIYPVCYRGADGEDIIFGVAAVDRNDQVGRFSNYGAQCTDIVAPGIDITGSQVWKPDQGFTELFSGGWSGTSLATPIVAGTALLIKAVNPRYQAPEIQTILRQSADVVDAANPSRTGKLGAGRVNAARAVELARNGVVRPSRTVNQGYLMVAPQSADGSVVKVLSATGAEVLSFDAYATRFRFGVKIAHGNVSGSDALDEIITAPGSGTAPEVKTFTYEGTVASAFMAYDKNFRGGVNVVTGDVDGNGVDEIIVAPGSGRENRVRVFYANGREAFSFTAFPQSISQGVNIAVGDLDGDGRDDIVAAPAKSAVPEVRVYSNTGEWQRAFMVYDARFRGGVNLAIMDIDGDGRNDLITGPGIGGGPHVRTFDEFGRPKQNFFVFDKKFTGGVIVNGVSF